MKPDRVNEQKKNKENKAQNVGEFERETALNLYTGGLVHYPLLRFVFFCCVGQLCERSEPN